MSNKILFFLLIIYSSLSFAANTQTILIVKPKQIVVNNKQATIYTIEQSNGQWGYQGTENEEFLTRVENQTQLPITIHWHGLVVPSNQDGVPYISQDPILPGAHYDYHFKLIQNGTYWMHSHVGFQMQEGLFAPLIIHDLHNPYPNTQEITMLLSDFSFKSPETINQSLKNSNMPMHHHHTPGMVMSAMNHHDDLNDVHYDAYLTNLHDTQHPQVIQVKAGSAVRLRVINGASASNFFIKLGSLQGQLIATDGHYIKAVKASIFSISEGQRLDILLKIPKNSAAAYPILAIAEGTNQQTGLILNTSKAQPPPLNDIASQKVGTIDALQDLRLHAVNPLPHKIVTRKINLSLEGSMSPYVWKINNEVWPHITPIKVKKGDRIEMNIVNHTDMSHPIHLHGHIFEVVSVNNKSIKDGPLRDTVLVPAHGNVQIIFDADNSGNWMLHCHVLYHSEDGMMTVMQYDDMPNPKLMSH